jgi:hypothetical protein
MRFMTSEVPRRGDPKRQGPRNTEAGSRPRAAGTTNLFNRLWPSKDAADLLGPTAVLKTDSEAASHLRIEDPSPAKPPKVLRFGNPDGFREGYRHDVETQSWAIGASILDKAGILDILDATLVQERPRDLRIGNAALYPNLPPEHLNQQYVYNPDQTVSIAVGWNYKPVTQRKSNRAPRGLRYSFTGIQITAYPELKSIGIEYQVGGNTSETLIPSYTLKSQSGPLVLEQEVQNAFRNPAELQTDPIYIANTHRPDIVEYIDSIVPIFTTREKQTLMLMAQGLSFGNLLIIVQLLYGMLSRAD